MRARRLLRLCQRHVLMLHSSDRKIVFVKSACSTCRSVAEDIQWPSHRLTKSKAVDRRFLQVTLIHVSGLLCEPSTAMYE